MSRAATGAAQNAADQANSLNKSSSENANSLYSTLVPTFTSEATNPQGFGKDTMADMNTAAQQSAGGSMASAVGAGTQRAAANRNAGSFAPTIDEASRDASRILGNETLGVRNENAKLKESQRQAGIAGLESLDQQQNSDVLGSIGAETGAANALTNSGKAGWFQNFLAGINALKPGQSSPEYGG